MGSIATIGDLIFQRPLAYHLKGDNNVQMVVRHTDKKLERLETDSGFMAGFDASVVKIYRARMQLIRAAADERAFYALKSLHFEKLRGRRSHERSMRLNKQFRLVLRFEESADKIVVIVSIEDYH